MIKNIFFFIFFSTSLFISTDIFAEEGEIQKPAYYKVTAAELNVRSEPSKNGEVLTTVKNGQILYVSHFVGKWGEINLGWISGKYLEFVSSVSDNHQNNSTSSSKYYQEHSSYNESGSGRVAAMLPNSTNIPPENNVIHASADNDVGGRLTIAVIVGILAIYIVMLLVGMAEKVVVYFDEADLVISLMPWIILVVAMILALIYQPDENTPDSQKMREVQGYVWAVALPLAAIFALWSIWLSIKYNHSFLVGLPYGIFKLISVLLGVLLLLNQIAIMKDEKTKRNQFFFAVIVSGVFIWLGKKLINGKKVYRNHGWTLPK